MAVYIEWKNIDTEKLIYWFLFYFMLCVDLDLGEKLLIIVNKMKI